ncbi:MAG TPA: hypothetical protein VFI02_18600, partial [Armatimonadota bacterium]|nr:hypothetical protein [Armatimonadota bacterium]
MTGIVWKDPAVVLTLVGNAACATINGLSPTAGDAYVVTDASTITLGSISTAIGDIVEYNGTIWVRLENGAGGFVPAGTRAIISTTTAVISPYSTSTDEGKIVDFTGASNTGVDTGDAVDGNALLLQDAGHVGYHDNEGYVFEGTVPTGSWILFTGAGTINAGAGLTKSGNTLNVGAGTGIAVGADTVAVDVTASLNITGDWNFGTGAGILGLPTAASTTEGDIWYVTAGDRVAFYAVASVKTVWDDAALAASSAQYSVLVADASTGWVEDTGFKVTSGAVTTGSWTATAVAAGYGGTGLDTSGSTGVATVSAGTWFVASSLAANLGGTGLTTYTDVGRILYSSGA